MEKKVVNPAAQLVPRPRDVDLTPEQLAMLGVFASLKKQPMFAKNPGTWLLRHYRPGEVICRQGDAGGTAFYMLTGRDLAALAKQLEGSATGAAQREFLTLLKQAQARPGSGSGGVANEVRRLATARLLVDTSRGWRAQRRWWAPWRRQHGAAESAAAEPAMIANDGPSDIDYQTRQAAIYEGEVFGEMSCLTRQPRSATIVADTPCFALEILRNILDQMRKDAGYKEITQTKYRQRVLEGHLRQLSIFRLLSDEQFRAVQQRVELVEFAPGTVLWDEGDPADSLLIVRSGIVQVVRSYPWRLAAEKVADWPRFLDALRTRHESDAAIGRLWKALAKEVQDAVTGAGDAPSDAIKQQIVRAFDEVAKTDALLTAKETKAALSDPTFVRETARFSEKAKDWTGLQIRRANRVLFHVLFPDLIAPPEPVGLARVMQLLGAGQHAGRDRPGAQSAALGHMHGLFASGRRPRSDRRRAGPRAGRRGPRDGAQSPAVRAEIKKIAATLTASDIATPVAPIGDLSQSRRVEELGLLQGQKLMLIDLDRCTRCGDCVQACIATHDDGHSRLFLDGPRFGKYLIPSACRQCRDPVCMIGCPVGSIQQGDSGEVVIRDWCIGCGLCANQCPYDSIQMHDAAVIRAERRAGIGPLATIRPDDTSWRRPSFRETKWHVGATPFHWGIAMRLAVNGASVKRIRFRHRFEVAASSRPKQAAYQLTVTSPGTGLEVYLNGSRLELTQDPPQKKRSEYAADIAGSSLRRGENVVAIAVAPAADFNALLLDVRLDRLAAESEEFEEKLVTERAVVCDQCSSLSGNRAACVYACPHDAAFRVDTWVDFPEAV